MESDELENLPRDVTRLSDEAILAAMLVVFVVGSSTSADSIVALSAPPRNVKSEICGDWVRRGVRKCDWEGRVEDPKACTTHNSNPRMVTSLMEQRAHI